jgi:hypothetical protein
MSTDMSVDRLLDNLFDELAGTGATGRRTLAEAEDHLRSAVAEGIGQGLPEAEAEADAVRRFGEPRRFAAGIKRAHLDLRTVARKAFTGAWVVGIVGGLTLALSGALSEAFGRIFGADFVSGDPSGVTYTPARCDDYFEYFPHAGSCAEAAALHHWGEVVEGRAMAGVLGLLGLLALLGARRLLLRGPDWAPPAPYVAAVLLTGLAGVGVLLGGTSVLSIAFRQSSGVGVNLADGIAAGVATLVVLVWSVRYVRRRA